MALRDLNPSDRIGFFTTSLTEANDVYSASDIDPEEWKKFYLGTNQWDDIKPEGELKVTVPITSVMVDQHVQMFSAAPPKINFKPPTSSAVDRLKAQVAEDQVKKVLYHSQFPQIFHEGVTDIAQLGEIFLYLYLDSKDDRGGTKGTIKLMTLSPSYTRPIHGQGFKFHPTGFVFWERMSPEMVEQRYGKEISSDSNYQYVSSLNLSQVEEKKVSVFHFIDDKDYLTVAGGEELDYGAHDSGFVPMNRVGQIYVPDSINSFPLLYRVDSVQQMLNLLFSAGLELALDLSYPALLEYNNALGSQKVTKWRRKKFKVRRSDKGEALSYLTPQANPQVLLNQIKSLIDLSYLLLQMPPVAMGVIEGQITSGFQAKVYQQPATVKQGSWAIYWRTALQDMSNKILRLIKGKYPSAISIELPTGEKFSLDGVENYEVNVDFVESTPTDDLRKAQMMIMRFQAGLISLYQALQEMGEENPSDSIDLMRQESNDPEIKIA